jgi:hypothetical protein
MSDSKSCWMCVRFAHGFFHVVQSFSDGSTARWRALSTMSGLVGGGDEVVLPGSAAYVQGLVV